MKIFLFTGLSASGKSTISKKVSNDLELPRIDLHSIIHDIATQGGYERARNWIMAIGTENALHEARKKLALEMDFARNSRGIIVDEILDVETLSFLKNRFSEDEFCSIYIRANRHDRTQFMLKRLDKANKKEALKEIRFIDSMKNRAGIKEIVSNADYKFNNFTTLEKITENVQSAIEKELVSPNREGSINCEREH